MEQVFACCQKFLELHFGLQSEAPNFGDLGLRLVSLGNPEKTVQGALQSFLSSKLRDYKFVSECGIYNPGARRSLDLTVFDNNWRLVCVIELKHYSRNQGSVAFLVNGLQADRERHFEIFEEIPPLVQVGIYTEIVQINPPYQSQNEKCAENHGFYRFIKTYCDNFVNMPAVNGQLVHDGWNFVVPEFSVYYLGERTVKGRVNYCIQQTQNFEKA